MNNESTIGFGEQTDPEHSIGSRDGFDGVPPGATDPVCSSGDAVTPDLAGLPGPPVVSEIHGAKLETATGDADHAPTPHPGSVMHTEPSLGSVGPRREEGRSGEHENGDQAFAIDNPAEWDAYVSLELLKKPYISWLDTFNGVTNNDLLRVDEIWRARPEFPDGTSEHHRALVEARAASALAKSRDYSLRFAGEVRARCESLGLPVRRTEAGAFTIDHFVTVSLSTSTSRRLVEVNRKRLEDPVTVERAVDLIRTQHRAIRAGFDAREFLTRLIGAYRHVASTRNNQQPTMTLADCLAALRAIFTEHHPVPESPPRRGRPPSGSAPGPRSTGGEYSETRFRSDLSRLLASDFDRIVDGHRLHVQQARGPGAMLLIEPRSGNPVHYRYVEFRRVSSDGEQWAHTSI